MGGGGREVGGRRQRREPRGSSWEAGEGFPSAGTPYTGMGAGAHPSGLDGSLELLSIFQKQTKKIRNHNLAYDEEFEIK